MPRPAPLRVAAALDYLERLKSQAAEFGGGVAGNLADRARSVGGLAYEALTSDPNISRMNTAEFSQAASRPTPRLDQTAQDFGTIGKAIVTQPIQTGKAIVQGEIDRAQEATTSPRAAGEYAGSFIDPMRIAAALRKTAPIAELDVYHGTPHRFPGTEENLLGEFDASKIGTGEGAQAYGHGVYYAENPEVAKGYQPRDPKAEAKLMNLYKQAEARQNYDQMEVLEAAMLYRTASELREQFPKQKGLVTRIGKINEKAAGSLYKADLPDEMIDRMLDWNKPLSQQPKNVRKAFDDVMTLNGVESYVPKDTGNKVYFNVGDSQDLMGHQIHNILKENLGGASESVSRNLKDYGIPGIKYLDAGSRGNKGDGTRNFVVFPGEEKKVRILERDGQKAPPQKIAQALEAVPSKDNLTNAQVEVDIYPLRSDPNTLYLSKIAVPKERREQGLGSQAMQNIVEKADAEGKKIVLSPSTEYGATSVNRLKEFYKRFGFVENKGRNKNYAISESMYRNPQ